jgi:hypothetical protein
MTRGVQIALTNVLDPEREAEFDRWYDDVHIPATLRLPGFVRARRFRLAEEQTAPHLAEPLGFRYLVIYEVDVDQIPAVRAALPGLVASTEGFSGTTIDPHHMRVAVFEQLSDIERPAEPTRTPPGARP